MKDDLGPGAVQQYGQSFKPERLSIDDLSFSGPMAQDDLMLLQDIPENPIYEGTSEEGGEMEEMGEYESEADIGTWPTPELQGGPMEQAGDPMAQSPRTGEEVALEMADVLRQKAAQRDAQSRAFQAQAQQGVDQGAYPSRGWY